MLKLFNISALLILAFSIATSKKAYAQSEFSFQNFNTEHGLPQNSIVEMTMDQDGYLWLSTQSNLVRYDGSGFKTFSFSNPKESAVNISFILNTNDESIVRVVNGKVYKLEKGRPVMQEEVLNTGYAIIHGYFPNRASFKGFNTTLHKYQASIPPKSNVIKAVALGDSSFLCGYERTSLLFLYKNGIQVKSLPIEGNLQSLLLIDNLAFVRDDSSTLYFFNNNTLNLEKVHIERPMINQSAKESELAFYPDQYSKTAWAVLNSTFYSMHFDRERNLMQFTPWFTLKDKEHFWRGIVYDSTTLTFFLSTLNEGLFRVKLHKTKTISITDSLSKGLNPIDVINYSVLKLSDTTAIIPTGFEFRKSNSGISVRKLGNVFSTRETIAKLKDGRIVTALDNKVFFYSPADNFQQREVFNNSFDKVAVSQISFLRPEGDSLWASSNDAIYAIDRKKIRTVYSAKSSDSFNAAIIRLFYRLNDREVIISNPYTTYQLQTTAPYQIKEIQSLKGKQVRYISAYKNVLILAVHHIGLYVMKDSNFYPVPVMPEHADISSCHSTYIDKEGFIWVTTNRGLYKSTAESIVDAAIKKKTIPFFIYYGKEDGITNTEFNGAGNPSYAVLNNEQLLYPSMGGIVTFQPASVNKALAEKKIFIGKIGIDSTEVDATSDSITLSPSFKYLTIEVSAPFYGDPRNLYLEYSLDSITWTAISAINQKRIILTDLPAGITRLLVRKRIGFGDRDYIYADPFFINRKKRVYEQAWFYLVVLSALGLLYFIIIKIQTQTIQKKKELLQKKVNEQTHELSQSVEAKDFLMTIIMHDMITPLRHIGLISGVLKKGFEKDPEKIKQALDDIQSTSERIMANSSNIINWIQYNNKQIEVVKEEVNLHDIVNDTLDTYMTMAISKNVSLVNEIHKAKFVKIDMTIFQIILDNIISNAIKHTTKGEIKVYMQSPAHVTKTTLKITDTGTGIQEEQFTIIQEILRGNLNALKITNKINTGLGYIMIAELVKLHNIDVAVETARGKGTTVTLTINNEYQGINS